MYSGKSNNFLWMTESYDVCLVEYMLRDDWRDGRALGDTRRKQVLLGFFCMGQGFPPAGLKTVSVL